MCASLLTKPSLLVAAMASTLLFGCTSEPIQDSRPLLGDLTELRPQQPSADSIGLAQRRAKLAQLYQQLLTMEPDPQIRRDVEYRLVQVNTERFQDRGVEPTGSALSSASSSDDDLQALDTLAQLERDDRQLQALVEQYQQLLQRYPTNANNEQIQYQLAKALALQGKLPESLQQLESLLQHYPNSQYLAEIQFRRGEIYYNLQHYRGAIAAYQAVLAADNNSNYAINSLYMTGWAQFKQNQLTAANDTFVAVLEAVIDAEINSGNSAVTAALNQAEFQFDQLSNRNRSLVADTRRVLSIALSQLQQSQSLIELMQRNQSLHHIDHYQHLLFADLAQFLWDNDFRHDAEQTYLAYLDLGRNDIWSARLSLALIDRYRQQGKFDSIEQIEQRYLSGYGLNGAFWPTATVAQRQELLPYLLQFSDKQARRSYAYAQQQPDSPQRIAAFADAAQGLKTYLDLAQLAEAKDLLTKPLQGDRYLYAEANFEAEQYQLALTGYAEIAYANGYTNDSTNDSSNDNAPSVDADTDTDTDAGSATSTEPSLQQQAAYATTVTIRALINSQHQDDSKDRSLAPQQQSNLIGQRQQWDRRFIEAYPLDPRALEIATQGAQLSFAQRDHTNLFYYGHFVLQRHGIVDLESGVVASSPITTQTTPLPTAEQLTPTALEQVQVVSQLLANWAYQTEQYAEAEQAYLLALRYLQPQQPGYTESRDLLASSIYFQAQPLKNSDPQQAIAYLLRLGQQVPESSYRVNAEFEAINLLLQQQQWQQAVDVMLPFQQRYPAHQYSAAIPAKLAQSYQELQQWDLAADQLATMATSAGDTELQREAQYSAAELYLKAGETEKARLAFRTYAHAYPQPFDVAQEVRFKMSEFYQTPAQQSKRHFWYLKIVNGHFQQAKQHQPGPRSAQLASMAAFELGQAKQQQFAAIKLKNPLQATLKRKQNAMNQAIKRYQQVLDLQLADYVPQATYQLAEMYSQLAKDLMASERPQQLDELALEEYEILLEELAYPFEEKAIEIHISNSQRAWQDIYDQWIASSFSRLAELSPALYHKPKQLHEVVDGIH